MTSIVKYAFAAAASGTASIIRYCHKKRPIEELGPNSEFYHGTTTDRFSVKEGDVLNVQKHFYFANEKEATDFAQKGVSMYRKNSINPENGKPILVKVSPLENESAIYQKGIAGDKYFPHSTQLKVEKIIPLSPLSPPEKAKIAEQRADILGSQLNIRGDGF